MSVLLFLLLFLVSMLLVGLLYGRNVESFQDFATGEKQFSTRSLVAAAVATFHGGGFLFKSLENGYSQGLYYAIANMAIPLSLFITARFFVIRMKEFLNHLSVAESMGALYGAKVRMITAICSMVMTVGSVAMEFNVIATLISIFFGNKETWPIIVPITVLLLYATFWGYSGCYLY